MIVTSLTGNIGCGKSSAINIIKRSGIKTLNSDEIGHNVLKSEEIKKKLTREFGKNIILESGEIDRKKLGEIVFGNSKKLEKLNKIVHPAILEEIYKELKEFSKSEKIVVLEIPLLFEVSLEKFFRPIILVYCSKENQIKRIKERDNLNGIEIEKRINSQIKIDEKISKSDFVIKNDGSKEELEKKVLNVLKDIKSNFKKWEKGSKWEDLFLEIENRKG